MDERSQKRKATVFPKNRAILETFGENVRLARRRRKYSKKLVCERTGFSRTTLDKIEKGDPSVAIGYYINVLAVLKLADDFAQVAADDVLGRKLQDLAL